MSGVDWWVDLRVGVLRFFSAGSFGWIAPFRAGRERETQRDETGGDDLLEAGVLDRDPDDTVVVVLVEVLIDGLCCCCCCWGRLCLLRMSGLL